MKTKRKVMNVLRKFLGEEFTKEELLFMETKSGIYIIVGIRQMP